MTDLDSHRPWPGPGYWDFRCLICSERVVDHSLWGYLKYRVRKVLR